MPKKVYGEYQVVRCPFCSRQSTAKNSQGIPVCRHHQEEVFGDIQCSCGEWLELKTGSYGPFYRCHHCGNISFQKALYLKSLKEKKETPAQNTPRSLKITNEEEIISIDDL
ncbi:MAG: hypothetical protein H6502_05040 [Candidatus Woesearchaeota archaeon]|nr:MAG: hypothetical protein H6502_05040 [Candidatus Woesearchaeota archaeon]